MNKNQIIIGGATLLVGGAIATGVFLNGFEKSSKESPLNENFSEKMEMQDFQEFADEERYSFCQGREEIRGVYENSVFGNEKGDVEYISDDISFFDKKRNKLYILGRRIEYKYSGKSQLAIAEGQGEMNIEESGAITEYFGKNNAPVRIDYAAKLINPAPERKSSDWVLVNIKSMGSLMGISDNREETMTGDAKVFCSIFNLDGAFISPDYFSFEKACPDNSPNPGVKFSGNFKFECGGLENKQGIEIAKEYQKEEQLRNEFNSISDESVEENEFEAIIKPGQVDDNRDVQRKLQEIRDEIKATASEN